MKIRNLLVLLTTMVLTTLCVSAQQSAGSVTFTDTSGQSLTISRFGTVLEFKDKTGKRIPRTHSFKICTCGKDSRCFEPNAPAEVTKASLEIVYPKKGKTIKNGKSLKLISTIWFKDVTVTRRVAWLAGSSALNVVETISADKVSVCDIQEIGITTPSDSCGMPPPRDDSVVSGNKCPPPPPIWWSPWLHKFVCNWRAHLIAYSMDLSVPPTVEP